MANFTDWREMREWEIGLLEKATGHGLEHWNARVLATGLQYEAELRTWLTEQGVTGYPRMLLVMERFGYPDFLLATSGELVDGQYADRLHLRPVCRPAAGARGGGCPRSPFRPARPTSPWWARGAPSRRSWPPAKTRVDLGLRLDGESPHGRLVDAKNPRATGAARCASRSPRWTESMTRASPNCSGPSTQPRPPPPRRTGPCPARPWRAGPARRVVRADRLRRIRFAREVAQREIVSRPRRRR